MLLECNDSPLQALLQGSLRSTLYRAAPLHKALTTYYVALRTASHVLVD